ncbi:MAG: RluA family pseudouridine synthase [Sphingomicrobium sp.]
MAEAYDKTFTIGEDDDGIRLDRWFKRHQPDVSFNIVSRWARTGQLRLDDKKAAPGDRIAAGQRIRFPDPNALPDRSERTQRVREPLTDEETSYVRDMVIYDDRYAYVLNKPPGLATQGGTKTHQHLDRLLDGLVEDDEARPKLVHRLDKDTSGALLVARTARSAGHFAKAFSSRTARKVYWAIVVGVPSANEGLIDLPLAKQPGTGGEKMHVSEEAGLASRSRWRVIDRAGNRAVWVELQPLTGRTHQLRVHMAALGHPIVGDAKYGGPEAFLTGGISRKMHLHARRIRVDTPGGEQIDVTANLPDHFAESLEMLGFDVMDGDRLPLEKPAKDADPLKAAKRVSAAAKARRKERKGERRSRGGQPKPAAKPRRK